MKKFDIVADGYDKDQVGHFVDDMIYKMHHYILTISKLESKIESLQIELDSHQQTRRMLEKTLEIAKSESKEIILLSNNKAKIIVNNAKREATSIVNEAILKSEEIEIESNVLRKNIRVFKNKLKVFMEGQLDMVDDIDKENY